MIHFILVSHGHDDHIVTLLDGLDECESSDFKFYVKDNIGSTYLKEYCQLKKIKYYYSGKVKGFAENNNEMTNILFENNFIFSGDYFIFINPDVRIDNAAINRLIDIHKSGTYDLFTIDLFKDLDMLIRDPSVRHFPRLMDFFSSFFFNVNKSIINREKIIHPINVDWFAGSFMAIKTEVFKSLKGFDQSYYMYCEDIDVCLRARTLGYLAYYLPEIKAVHYTQHQNRKIFNRHLMWHIKSILILYIKNYKHIFKYSR